MDQSICEHRFGYQRHLIFGQIGQVHVKSGLYGNLVMVITLQELNDHYFPTGNYHQIIFQGEDSQTAMELDLQSEDLIIVSLEDLRAKAYLDPNKVPSRPIGYFESRGREPFIVERPTPGTSVEMLRARRKAAIFW
jgi:hypothetical protein